MSAEEIWRRKSDEDVGDAATRLGEYTEAGQRVILAELQRRREAGALIEVDAPIDDARGDAARHAPAPPFATREWFGFLWRGNIPLAKTYWVYGFLTNLVLLALFALAMVLLPGPLLFLPPAAYLAYHVIIMVAIWRSAGRYTGKRVWAEMARISVAASLARSLVALVSRLAAGQP